MPTESVDIGDAPDAVPAARRFTRSALTRLGCVEVVESAELVVSELVTNALLHAGAPVRLTLSGGGDACRVEVLDRSVDIPVLPHLAAQGMTGRGLALVDAIADSWGASRTPDGKVIWAELTASSVAAEQPGDAQFDALVAAFDDRLDDAADSRFTVTLGDVPTALLLEAKAHVDSVIRELTLSATGAASGMSAALPPHLGELVHNVATEFSAARQSIKRQALAAAETGSARTTLTLTVPASAADAGERYLQALEDADAYAREARLLTLAAPPQHRAFRRWYVTSLVDALRRQAGGDEVRRPPTFEEFLLGQVDELAELQEVSNRAARLQRVTAALAAELSAQHAIEVSLDDAMAELAADRGCVLVLADGAVLTFASRNMPADHHDPMAAAWSSGGHLPTIDAARDRRAVWLESREESTERYPLLSTLEPDAAALCAIPMTVGDRVVGVLRLTFLESRLFTSDERAFLVALSAVAAQAVERARLYQSQATIADHLSRLQEVTSALSRAQSLDDVLDVAIAHATGLVGARIASISLVDQEADRDEAAGGTVRLVRMQPPTKGAEAWATYDVEADLPAAAAIRTGEPVHIASVAERNANWPALAPLEWGFEHALLVLPLHSEGGTVGALTLSFTADGEDGEPARDFLAAFADACAQAIERARAAERAKEANRRLTFIAHASEQLGASLDVNSMLADIARMSVPELADWCVVHLLRNGELEAVALEHVDPAKRQLAVDVERRWPERLSGASVVGRVIRTGETVRIPDVQAFTERTPSVERDPEHTAFIRQLDLRSVIIVPLRGRARPLGAMTFIAAESGRRYTAADQSFIEDLAKRAAIAIENANLFRESTAAAAGRLRTSLGAGTPDTDEVLTAAAIGRFEFRIGSGEVDVDRMTAHLYDLDVDLDVEAGGGLTGIPIDMFYARMHPDDVDRVTAAVSDAVDRGLEYGAEYRVVARDGSHRWIVARGSVVPEDETGPARLAGIVYESTDVHDRREELARLLETMTDAFYRVDRDWRFTYTNSQAERLLYRPRSELLGRVLWEACPEFLGTEVEQQFKIADSTRQQVAFEFFHPPFLGWFEVRATPDAQGLSVFFHDITARKEAERARTQANERLSLLGEAARGLVGTLDVGAVMNQVASVVVPRLADWAVLSMEDAAGDVTDSFGLHYDPVVAAETRRAAELAGRALAVAGVWDARRGRRAPVLLSALDMKGVVGASPGSEWPNLLETLGFASVAVVPVESGAAILGVMVLVNGPARSPFDDQDLATAIDIGRRAGLAIENAQLYARQRTASEVLQRSLLTPLPDPARLRVVARYRPAGQEAQIGGDWYDAFQQPDGATVLAIGDVVGHDMNAAAAMGQLRNLLRGVAFDRLDPPAAVLRRVDSAIRGLRIDTLATAVVGRLEQTPEQRLRLEYTFRWSNAGHPPPLLKRANGVVVFLEASPDLMLGFDARTDRSDHMVTMHAGDTLLLYTDGLVERRDSPIEDGLNRLQAVLGEHADLELDELCDRLVDRLLPDDADDDVALVAVQALRS